MSSLIVGSSLTNSTRSGLRNVPCSSGGCALSASARNSSTGRRGVMRKLTSCATQSCSRMRKRKQQRWRSGFRPASNRPRKRKRGNSANRRNARRHPAALSLRLRRASGSRRDEVRDVFRRKLTLATLPCWFQERDLHAALLTGSRFFYASAFLHPDSFFLKGEQLL